MRPLYRTLIIEDNKNKLIKYENNLWNKFFISVDFNALGRFLSNFETETLFQVSMVISAIEFLVLNHMFFHFHWLVVSTIITVFSWNVGAVLTFLSLWGLGTAWEIGGNIIQDTKLKKIRQFSETIKELETNKEL